LDAIFVKSSGGADNSTCGTVSSPCASINQGQVRAVATGKTDVYVAGGTYPKFNVVEGLQIVGGYGQNWQRGLNAKAPTVSNVNASFAALAKGPVAMIADGIGSPTRVAGLRLNGGTAGVGQTSYTAFVRDSTDALVLDSLQIVGGT